MSALETLFDNEIPAGRQALENSQANLLDVATYCEENYVKAEDKRIALEETKNYTTQSLASVAYQINTLATSMLQMLDLQVNQLSTMEASVNHIAQTVSIHKEKVARREIGVLTTNKNVTRTHKIIAPANPERPAKYKSKIIDYTSLDGIGHGLKITQSKQRTHSTSSAISVSSASLPIVQPDSKYGTIRTQPVRPPKVPDVGQSQSMQRTTGPPPPPSMTQGQPNQSKVSQQESPYMRQGSAYMPQGPPQPPQAPQMIHQPNIGPVRPAPAPPPPAPMPSTVPPPPPPMGPPDMAPPPPVDQGFNRVPSMHQESMPPPPPEPVDDRPSFSMSELNRALSMNRGGYRPEQQGHYPVQTEDFGDMPPPPPPDDPPMFDMTMSPLPPPPPENFEAIDYDEMLPAPPPQFLQEDEPEWVPKDYIQKVVAIYDYSANQDDELTFQEGNIIYVVKMNEDGWYEGVMEGVTGLFPGNHVEICP